MFKNGLQNFLDIICIVFPIPDVLDEDNEDEEEPPDPLDDNLIKTLIEQKSDDEQENNSIKDKEEIIKEEIEGKSENIVVVQDETNKEELEEEVPEDENFEDDISKTESLSMSLSRGDGAEEEEIDEVTISDPIEIKEDNSSSAHSELKFKIKKFPWNKYSIFDIFK